LTLVNDVLDISKIEAGRMTMHPEELPVVDLLRETNDVLLTLAQKKGVTMVLEQRFPSPWILADRHRFVQVLYNLLSNAVKFTPPGGRIDVSCAQSADTVFIQVRDTGIGISAEHQRRIFDKFEQVDSSMTRSEQGTGLGLALTRRLVEMQGGSIEVQSKLGQGSTFTVCMPRVEPGRAELPLAPHPIVSLVGEGDQS
jgi:signal transduction histidine kinase